MDEWLRFLQSRNWWWTTSDLIYIISPWKIKGKPWHLHLTYLLGPSFKTWSRSRVETSCVNLWPSKPKHQVVPPINQIEFMTEFQIILFVVLSWTVMVGPSLWEREVNKRWALKNSIPWEYIPWACSSVLVSNMISYNTVEYWAKNLNMILVYM